MSQMENTKRILADNFEREVTEFVKSQGLPDDVAEIIKTNALVQVEFSLHKSAAKAFEKAFAFQLDKLRPHLKIDKENNQ